MALDPRIGERHHQTQAFLALQNCAFAPFSAHLVAQSLMLVRLQNFLLSPVIFI